MAVKILTIEQIRKGDAYTMLHEPIASHALMERAASACFERIIALAGKQQNIRIFCGMGNNGGDGLVIARLLAQVNIKVLVYIARHRETGSDDFNHNLIRLKQETGLIPVDIVNSGDLPFVSEDELIIDALLGSGLSNPVVGLLAEIIRHLNDSPARIISIDVPSGMFCDRPSDPHAGAIIEAWHTLAFEFPRLGFLFPENEHFIGDWTVVPIGIHEDFIINTDTKDYLIERFDCQRLIKTRPRFAHKGHFGHGLLISGGYGKMGAAVMAARAALRSGAGLITAHIPSRGYDIIQAAVPEAMTSIDESNYYFTGIADLTAYNAVACGPGIGLRQETAKALKFLIQNSLTPMILDADALNILGENKTWLPFLPQGSILTPHLKEFERITHKVGDSFERHRLQREFSIKYSVFVVLKGAYSCISFPDGRCFFNPTGNPGMATGGSGDVLTGILLGLMAQGYAPSTICILGTYIHGLAGDLAADKQGYEGLIAGDIIEHIPGAILKIKS